MPAFKLQGFGFGALTRSTGLDFDDASSLNERQIIGKAPSMENERVNMKSDNWHRIWAAILMYMEEQRL